MSDYTHYITDYVQTAALVRISSPDQLDIPQIYLDARRQVEELFPSGPKPFDHPPFLVEALELALKHEIPSVGPD